MTLLAALSEQVDGGILVFVGVQDVPTVASAPRRVPTMPEDVVPVPDEPIVESVSRTVPEAALALPVPPDVVEEDALLFPVPPEVALPPLVE